MDRLNELVVGAKSSSISFIAQLKSIKDIPSENTFCSCWSDKSDCYEYHENCPSYDPNKSDCRKFDPDCPRYDEDDQCYATACVDW